MSNQNEQKQYIGPPHFWHRYALNDREQYYYGIGGIYGPSRGPSSFYKDVVVTEGCGSPPFESFLSGNSETSGNNLLQKCPCKNILIILAILAIATKLLK